MRISKLLGFSALGLVLTIGTAQANLVTNGGFETTNTAVSSEFGADCGAASNCHNVTVSGWAASGYEIIMLHPTDVANTKYGLANVSFFGPPTYSPDGGHFIAVDPVYPTTTGR